LGIEEDDRDGISIEQIGCALLQRAQRAEAKRDCERAAEMFVQYRELLNVSRLVSSDPSRPVKGHTCLNL
jgi:hypothetical protein